MSEKKSKYDKMLEKIKFKADIPQNPKTSISFDVEPPCFFVGGIDNTLPRVDTQANGDQESQPDNMTPSYKMPTILPQTKSYNFSSNKSHNEFYDMSPKNIYLSDHKSAGHNNLGRIDKSYQDTQNDKSFDLKQQQQQQDILTPKRHLRILTDPSDSFKAISSFMSPIHSKSPRLSSIHHSSPSKQLTMSLRLRAKQFLLNQQSNSNLDNSEKSYIENTETTQPTINYEQNQKINISNKLPQINLTTPKRISVSLPKSKGNSSYLSNQQSEKQQQQQSNTLFGYHFDFIQEDLSPKRKNERRALQTIEKLFVQSKSIQIGKTEKNIMGNSEFTRISTDIKKFQEQQKDEQNKQQFMNFMDKTNNEPSQQDIALISSYPTKSNLEELRCDLEKKQVDVEFEASQRSIKKLKRINVALKQKTKIDRDFPIQEMPQCLKVKSNHKL